MGQIFIRCDTLKLTFLGALAFDFVFGLHRGRLRSVRRQNCRACSVTHAQLKLPLLQYNP
jgi:hypothetical protein